MRLPCAQVSRITLQSITYYFAKYHVLLCQVSLDVFFPVSFSDFIRNFFD